MDDLISRQEARLCLTGDITNMTIEQYIKMVGERLGALTPSKPKVKEADWIPHESPDGSEQYECSECGLLWEFNDGTPEDNEAYFCPKCGAKMKGEQNERFD